MKEMIVSELYSINNEYNDEDDDDGDDDNDDR